MASRPQRLLKSLRPLRSVRDHALQQAQSLLAQALRELQEAKGAHAALEQDLALSVQRSREAQADIIKSLGAQGVSMGSYYQDNLRMQIRHAQILVEEAEANESFARQQVAQAKQQLDVIDKLIDKAHEQIEKEQQAAQQTIIDEIAQMRHNRT